MDLTDFDFSLSWPKELFLWEARRIGALRRNRPLASMVACLFAEAFVDGDIAANLDRAAGGSVAWGGPPTPVVDEAARVLDALLKNPDTLHPYKAPRYWLERQSGSRAVTHHKTLPAAFVDLVAELRTLGYFPKVLPKPCVDDNSSWEADPSADLSRAIHVDVSWPLDDSALSIADDVLFSVIEYFHDQAQRPRTRSFHPYAECGWHYDDHNRESGSVVYRWRANELLDSYGIGFHLGSRGREKGRLIRHASLQLDDLAAQLVGETEDTDDAKIAAAIQLYRARASNVHDRRAAIAQLAGFLERHRQKFKTGELTKGDESDLFQIFNKFTIRHDNAIQKGDYGDEYLDWVFWTTLAAVRLVKQLQDRKQ